jgi:hypothetical protein
MSYTPLNDILLTGDPRATTPTAGDNDTSVATTAFVQTELGDYLALAGGTMTGDITLGSGVDINFDDTSSGLQWSDVRVSRTAANIIALGSGDKIQQNAAPTVGDDLVNKTYADSLANGLDLKASVRVATAAALPAYTRVGNVITSDTNVSINAAGVDGVTDLSVGQRVLLKDGAAGADNGIYEVTAVGSGAAPFVLTRTSDADNSPAGEVTAGMYTFVEEGSANGDEGWVLVTNNPITLNTTALTFSQFSSAAVVSTLDSLTDVDTSGVVDGALLRYESTGTQWNDTASLLFNDSGQLQVTTTGSSAGIVLGGDAQWYRSAADTMRTPDALVVDGLSTLTGAVTATNGVTATTGGFSATAGDITAVAGNIAATVGTLSIGSTSTLTGLVTATGGVTTATGNYTTTGSGGFVASGSGAVSTSSGNISSSTGNLVITAGTSTLGGKVTMSAAQKVKYGAVKTANYTASLTADYIIPVNSSGGAFTISLPAGHAAGDTFTIKDVNGSLATNNVTIDPNGSETIDGAATFAMTVNRQAVTVVSDGTNWFII